jgi:putative hemolysin
VSNHPFGGADGLLLYEAAHRVRSDVKVMTNFILSMIGPLSDDFLPVNPFRGAKWAPGSSSGMKQAIRHLENGGLLIIFPAGEVSTIPKRDFYKKLFSRRVMARDIPWENSSMKLIARSGCPVIPVYFHGQNSRLFHLAGRLNPYLRTALLPREFLKARKRTAILKIGKAVSAADVAALADKKMLSRHLYARCYALEANIPATNEFLDDGPLKPIVKGKSQAEIEWDIDKARANGNRLFETAGYEVFLLTYREYHTIMYELARLREITFREIGEGTGKSCDTDEYDVYYKHLVLWDVAKRKIAGAYRIGIGSEIVRDFGLSGFYVDTLFHYRKGMEETLKQSIELGRSFVVSEYQKEIFPLMLLIKGILFSTMRYPEVRYVIGPVSISSWYPDLYKSIFVKYLSENFGLPSMKKLIDPEHRFKNRVEKVNIDDLLLDKCDSIEHTDRYIMALSNGRMRIPSLIKRYLKIGVKVIDFNVDPLFNYCVDGLILLDTDNVSEKELNLLLKGEKNIDSFIERFYKKSL